MLTSRIVMLVIKIMYPQENISLLASRDDQISNLESALTMSQKEFADAQNALLLANKDNNV